MIYRLGSALFFVLFLVCVSFTQRAEAQQLYFLNSTDGTLEVIDLANTGSFPASSTVVTSGLGATSDLCYDDSSGFIYWTERGICMGSADGSIRRLDILNNATTPENVISNLECPETIGCDSLYHRLFFSQGFATQNEVSVYDLTQGVGGSSASVITSFFDIVGVAVGNSGATAAQTEIIYSEFGSSGTITKIQADGSNATVVRDQMGEIPTLITADPANDRIFWINSNGQNDLNVLNLTSQASSQFCTAQVGNGINSGTFYDRTNQLLYWQEDDDGVSVILRASGLDLTCQSPVIIFQPGNVVDLTGIVVVQPTPTPTSTPTPTPTPTMTPTSTATPTAVPQTLKEGGTPKTIPPDSISVDDNDISITVPPVKKFVDKRGQRRKRFQYFIVIRRTGSAPRPTTMVFSFTAPARSGASDVIERISKRNTITVKNLKSGRYSVRYRVEAIERRGRSDQVVARTNFSRPRNFTVSRN